MKPIILFFWILLFLTSCEKDDVCIEPLTPRLNIAFYKGNQTLTLNHISVKWKGRKEPIFIKNQTKTALIPLNFISNSTQLEINSSYLENKTIDVLTIKYDIEKKFVSKACGFKFIYNKSTINATNIDGIKKIEWVKAYKDKKGNKKVKILKTRNIVFEQDEHIRIYY